MNAIIDKHARCIELLPAFVAGTLPPHVANAVIAHASECSGCNAELESARRLNAHFARVWSDAPPSDPLLDPAVEQASFDQLWARIIADSTSKHAPPARHAWPARFVALAATLLVGVAGAWYFTAGEPQYHTLADPSHSCVALRVQFAASTPTVEALRIIEGAGARVLSSSQNVYTVNASDPAEALRQLRTLSGVAAEPTGC